MNDIAPGRLPLAPSDAQVCHRHLIRGRREMIVQTPLDPFMKGAEWSAPGKLKPAA
jgi:hypothetical protein